MSTVLAEDQATVFFFLFFFDGHGALNDNAFLWCSLSNAETRPDVSVYFPLSLAAEAQVRAAPSAPFEGCVAPGNIGTHTAISEVCSPSTGGDSWDAL
uniref:Uncharacterized protein n=1 Tax=Ixodes ricinus TaxID=34613 RepID=A0A6B0U558_IXORI